MRWIILAILIYALCLVQISLVDVLTVNFGSVGPVRPDLLAMLAVFVALFANETSDAMLAAWLMGLAIDLTTGSGGEVSTVVGPMPLAYALVAGLIHRMKEMVFRQSILAQCIMAMLFCVLAHSIWVTAQWLIVMKDTTFSRYLLMLLQVLLAALYTALLMPAASVLLMRCRRLIIAPQANWRRRR